MHGLLSSCGSGTFTDESRRRRFYPCKNLSTEWHRRWNLTPASTRVSGRMNPPPGGISSGTIIWVGVLPAPPSSAEEPPAPLPSLRALRKQNTAFCSMELLVYHVHETLNAIGWATESQSAPDLSIIVRLRSPVMLSLPRLRRGGKHRAGWSAASVAAAIPPTPS